MNIFALSDDPHLAAIWQHDKHVVKMTLETAQLVSQAIRLRPDWLKVCNNLPNAHEKSLYGTTHQHHPCAKWSRENEANFRWLVKHGLALADEYALRYGGCHASKRIIQLGGDTLDAMGIYRDEDLLHTPFAMAMPYQYQIPDSNPVNAYRRYYLAEKCDGMSGWRRRDQLPDWLLDKALDFRPEFLKRTKKKRK